MLTAGVWAGAINTLVGSGTLVTFPTLLWVGYPPVVANVSNNIGLIGGTIAGSIGYRRELEGQWRRTLRFAVFSMLGAATGATLLLVLPPGAFEAIVPGFIAISLVLIVLQPRLQRALMERRGHGRPHEGVLTRIAVYLAGIYGGYFGAAQGILLLAIFGLALPEEDLQRVNGLKNVLAAVVNLVAGIVFVFVADVAWEAAALVGVGAIVGGHLGARYGRRLDPAVLRGVIIVVGVAAIVQLLR